MVGHVRAQALNLKQNTQQQQRKTMTNKEFVTMVWEKQCPKIPLPADFSPLAGLEGPYLYRNGRVLYFDPKEQKYYDRGQDLYLSDREAERTILNLK